MDAKENKTRTFNRLDSPLGIDIMRGQKKAKTTVKKIYAILKGRLTNTNDAIKVLNEYAESYASQQMPSDEDTLKYFYHIGGRDKLMNINLKNKVTFGDRLEEFKQNSASQTEMPSEEGFIKWCIENVSTDTKRFDAEYKYAIWIEGEGLCFSTEDDLYNYYIKQSLQQDNQTDNDKDK